MVLTIYGLNTSHEVWIALATNFACPSQTHISQLRHKLQTLHLGTKTCFEYLQEAKSLVDELGQLALVRKSIDEQKAWIPTVTPLGNQLTGS